MSIKNDNFIIDSNYEKESIKEYKTFLNCVYQKIKLEITKYYDKAGIEYKDSCPKIMIEEFFSYFYKLIPPKKRRVYYSNEIEQKIIDKTINEENTHILSSFKEAFEEGKDMNQYLSTNINNPRNPDFLLYTWHLYHLHLSKKTSMKNNRSKTQILCIVNEDAVFFVDIINHPKNGYDYFDIRHLRVIVKNGWMKRIGFYVIPDYVPGSLKPVVTDSKALFNLYTHGFTVSFEFDGVGYVSMDPMMADRIPYRKTVNRVPGIFYKLLFWWFDRCRIICEPYLRGYWGKRYH